MYSHDGLHPGLNPTEKEMWLNLNKIQILDLSVNLAKDFYFYNKMLARILQ